MHVGYLLFPNLTQLDLTGPLQVLARLPGATTHIVAKSLTPVMSDCNLALLPTTTFADCPPLDVLVVPGGFGTAEAIGDAALIDFIARSARSARYTTSVCTGAFLLGAAGLLRGKRATTHWAYHELLPLVGATAVRARSVIDGPVITGGGVTAGIDFGLTLFAEIAGADAARAVQLGIEYDPAPPFDSGSPATASPQLRARLQAFYDGRRQAFSAALAAAPRLC